MSRPLHIEFPGSVYHVASRRVETGARASSRTTKTGVLYWPSSSKGLERFDSQMLTYCLMGNHYHFVLHTRSANLSLLMRHINGVYSQCFNRRHGLVGHLLQGRFKAIPVDRDAYLFE